MIAKAIELLSKIPLDVLPHVVDFLSAVITGDRGKAERAATLATTEQLFDRPRTE